MAVASIDMSKPVPLTPMAIVAKALVFLATGLLLFAAYTVYMIGQPLFGVIVTIVALGFLFVFGLRRFYFARFIYPGIATMALFVIFPIFYTIYRVFWTITLPQILPPFLPLLLASFAFNFNNIVLVLLLTRGGPDMPGTIIPAGETDILGSFTYRIAFMDSGTQFGLSGAITLLIFILVSIMAYANFVFMRRAANKG